MITVVTEKMAVSVVYDVLHVAQLRGRYFQSTIITAVYACKATGKDAFAATC